MQPPKSSVAQHLHVSPGCCWLAHAHLLPSPSFAAAPGPQDPYVNEAGIMFTLYTNMVNYTTARDTCNAAGAHLAVFGSIEEQAEVEDFYIKMVGKILIRCSWPCCLAFDPTEHGIHGKAMPADADARLPCTCVRTAGLPAAHLPWQLLDGPCARQGVWQLGLGGLLASALNGHVHPLGH